MSDVAFQIRQGREPHVLSLANGISSMWQDVEYVDGLLHVGLDGSLTSSGLQKLTESVTSYNMGVYINGIVNDQSPTPLHWFYMGSTHARRGLHSLEVVLREDADLARLEEERATALARVEAAAAAIEARRRALEIGHA